MGSKRNRVPYVPLKNTKSPLLLIIAFIAGCEEIPKEPNKDTWVYMSAQRCVSLCKPLNVAHFTPGCSQKNGQEFACSGTMMHDSSAVCACGASNPKQTPINVEAPDLITPVFLHHGLNFVLGK